MFSEILIALLSLHHHHHAAAAAVDAQVVVVVVRRRAKRFFYYYFFFFLSCLLAWLSCCMRNTRTLTYMFCDKINILFSVKTTASKQASKQVEPIGVEQ